MLIVSICIPAYNGSHMLREALESLIAQIVDGVEIVVCDDRSKDDTFLIAKEYAEKYPFVKAFQNEKNVGMDRNFTQAVAHARGEFIWLSGQDDIFEPGAISKFLDIARNHRDVDFAYFNYRFLSGDLSKEVATPPLSLDSDMLFENAEHYFSVLDDAPSFLAATVMRREFWLKTPVEIFWGTHYVQVGVWLLNCLDRKVYVVASPKYISCRVPEDSWKYSGGQMLFRIFSGQLEVYCRVYKAGIGTVTAANIRKKRDEFIAMLPHLIFSLSSKGFRLTDGIKRRMKYIFGDNRLLYLFYIAPLIHLPPLVTIPIRYVYDQGVLRAPLRGIRRIVTWFGGWITRP